LFAILRTNKTQKNEIGAFFDCKKSKKVVPKINIFAKRTLKNLVLFGPE
jgi:hypothetical protein